MVVRFEQQVGTVRGVHIKVDHPGPRRVPIVGGEVANGVVSCTGADEVVHAVAARGVLDDQRHALEFPQHDPSLRHR